MLRDTVKNHVENKPMLQKWQINKSIASINKKETPFDWQPEFMFNKQLMQ